MTSRAPMPAQEQVEALVDFVERRRWLATGHARTMHARQRWRTAWQEITLKLNRVDCGCRKTWQQWAKYWKDKKGAVKRKLVLIRTTNRTHPGEDGEEEALSSLEKRILALIGGRVYALSNKEEEGGKLYALTNKEQEIGKVYALSNKETGKLYAISNKEEENDPFTNFNLEEERVEVKPFDIAFLNVSHAEANDRTDFDNHTSEELPAGKPFKLKRNLSGNDLNDGPAPRLRRLMTPPPSPHRDRERQLVDFTDRILAIEERRVETERIIAQSQQELVGVLRQMSEAWTIQSAAIKELVSRLSNQ